MIYLLVFFFLTQILFAGFIFTRVLFYKPLIVNKLQNKPISIIICARNEAENLKKFIPLILNQQYLDYELIIVNDRSEDNTGEVAAAFAAQNSRIKIINIQSVPVNFQPKKYAISQAVALANNEFLLFTDADCWPKSENWIQIMQSHLTDNQEIVLGVSLYQKSNTCLNACIQYETFYTAIQYLSFALIGQPYMGVGRNLLYKKSLFIDNQGFAQHQGIKGGDDDLFIGRVANARNTSVCFDNEAFTYSLPKENWKEWWQQKIRHLSVGKYYHPQIKFFLGLLNLSHFGFWFLALILLFLNLDTFIINILIGMISVRIGLIWLIFTLLNQKLRAQVKVYWIPLFDFLFGFYIFIVGLIAISQKNIQWKN
jgi:glycosyltransferase involved in cell wall biosynthesis